MRKTTITLLLVSLLPGCNTTQTAETRTTAKTNGTANASQTSSLPIIPPKGIEIAIVIYPYQLAEEQIEGSATVEFTVNADGTTSHHKIVTSTRPEFEQPAINAIKESTFSPATQGGNPVAIKTRLTIEFRM